MRVAFSPKAAIDLEEIGDYIARDHPIRAVSFIKELIIHCRQITETPEAFPVRNDIATGLRMAVHGNYLILFHIVEKAVRIERIVHGARKLFSWMEKQICLHYHAGKTLVLARENQNETFYNYCNFWNTCII